MDKNNESIDQQKSTEQLQEVSRLAELYARHRTAGPFFVWSVMIVGIRMAIYLVRPYIKGHGQVSVGLVLGVMGLVLGVTLFLCIGWLGGRLLQRWGQKLFDKDGQARERILPSLIPQWVFVLAAAVFGICLAGEIILGVMGYLPEKYMQPISAVYVVSFMIFLGLWRRTPVTSAMMGLCPVPGAVHCACGSCGNWRAFVPQYRR